MKICDVEGCRKDARSRPVLVVPSAERTRGTVLKTGLMFCDEHRDAIRMPEMLMTEAAWQAVETHFAGAGLGAPNRTAATLIHKEIKPDE